MEILFLKAVINGLVVGAIYGLIGAGLNILYGVLRVVNFAHGEFIVVGSFVAYVMWDQFGLSPFYALPVGMAAFFVAGCAFYRILIPRLLRSDDPETSSFLVMFGISLMLTATMLFLFEADPRSLNFALDPLFVKFGKLTLPTSRIAVLGITVLIVIGLTWLIYYTDTGRALRAAIQNRDAVQIVGADIGTLSMMAFGIAASLAGSAGILVAMVFPAFSPFIGPDYTLVGFIVIVIGGLGNPIGGLIGGLLFGLIEQVGTVMFSQSIAFAFGFAMMIAVIAVRPEGLLARRRLK